jgi:autophagy-related protein 9
MFNHKYQLRPAFYLDPAALRRRFWVCGMAHIVFMPFLLFFLLLHFWLQNAYDWKSTKQYLGPREWSLHAKWVFREFNELPHNFERRMAPSYPAAEAYLKLFGSNEILSAIGRVLVFCGGSLGAVLFVFAAMNDAILLHIKIADWNLLWYLGMVGVVYSTGKAMTPEGSNIYHTRNLFAETDEALQSVGKHTHYFPSHWKHRGSDAATKKAMSTMFQYKAQLFGMQVASIIFAPYILCVKLANCSESICEYVLTMKEHVDGAGDVCGFSAFDFDKHGDEPWEGRTMNAHQTLAESILQTRSVAESLRNLPTPRARQGKMEKSFFNFKVRSNQSKQISSNVVCSSPPIQTGSVRRRDKLL